MNKKQKIFNGIVLAIILYIAIFEIFGFRTILLNRENKKALAIIMNELKIGDSKEQVKNVFYEYKTKTLKLMDDRENSWLIEMPFEFGASDWILWIEFDENDKIVSLKMRTSDSKKLKPKGVPGDKILQSD